MVRYVSCFVQTFGPSSKLKMAGNTKIKIVLQYRKCLKLEDDEKAMLKCDLCSRLHGWPRTRLFLVEILEVGIERSHPR